MTRRRTDRLAWRAEHPGGRTETERGSVLVMTAVLMAVLVGTCAFAIDVGQIYNVRRQAQSSVDAAALAGGAELTKFIDGQSTRRSASAAWVKATSYRSVEVAPGTPAQWNEAWTDCKDPDHLPITSSASSALSNPSWPAAGPSECISFSHDMRTIRVRLPVQTVDTIFGGVFGVDRLSTGAVAHAELSPGDEGGILPFAVYAADSTGHNICVAATSSFPANADYPFQVCGEGSSSGNFGTLNISVWGNANMARDCESGDQGNVRLMANIAEGVDHMILPHQGGDPDRYDLAECEGDHATPNNLMTRTGNQFAVLPPGLINGVTYGGQHFDGRLTRGDGPKRAVYGASPQPIDDLGLWRYLNPDLEYPEVPANCDARTFEEGWTPELTPDLPFPAYPDYLVASFLSKHPKTFVPGNVSRLHMERCMQDYTAMVQAGESPPPLFTDELATSARLGWLPILDGTEPPSGTNEYRRVVGFKAVYLNTIFGSCNPHGCDQIWEPGESTHPLRMNVSVNNHNAMAAVGAYQFLDPMLPVSVQDTNPTYGGGFDGVQLSR